MEVENENEDNDSTAIFKINRDKNRDKLRKGRLRRYAYQLKRAL